MRELEILPLGNNKPKKKFKKQPEKRNYLPLAVGFILGMGFELLAVIILLSLFLLV